MEAAAFFTCSNVNKGPGPLVLPAPWHPLLTQLFCMTGLTSVINFADTLLQAVVGLGGSGPSLLPLLLDPLLHATITHINVPIARIYFKLLFILSLLFHPLWEFFN